MADEQARALHVDEAMDRWLAGGAWAAHHPSTGVSTVRGLLGIPDDDVDAGVMTEMAGLVDALGMLTEEEWDTADVLVHPDA